MSDKNCDRPPEDLTPDRRPLEGEAADKELARRGQCLWREIVEELPLAQSTVSEHIRVLKEAGMIRGEIGGSKVCYRIKQRTLRRLKSLIAVL